MTDFQFTAVIKMVIGILSRCKSVDEALDELKKLIGDDEKRGGAD